MEERRAKSLSKLLRQVDAVWPNRSKESDGWIASSAHHAANPTSDHEADSRGIVHAIDITHDPAHGLDSERLAQGLIASKDRRIKYIISNRKIAAGDRGPSPWTWRPYNGSNPHDHHVHISVLRDFEDDETQWNFAVAGVTPQPDPNWKPPPPTLRRGMPMSEQVGELWTLLALNDKGFGPVLEAAVEAFQQQNGLHVDGIVGPQTWARLRKAKET